MKENMSLELKSAREEVVRAQVERFHEFYSSYFNQKETIEMAKFFFETVYNLEGKEEWETLAFSTYAKVKHMMKEGTRESVERLIELNTITDELDVKLAELLLKHGWKPGTKISGEEYFQRFQELGEAESRKKQLEVVLYNLRKFYDLAHRPINSYIMKPAAVMARMLGVYPLFKKVEQGYYATLPVSPEIFNSFFDEVEKREWEFLFRAFPELKK
ncbi:FFLEELY motif protein [Leptospira sp. 'Mane']|uniref:FFLEELY motif protein n=1 Tax=Leptospira sp. 'Mane' TaxID=3387407 RepID=UPI00398B44F1